MSSSSCVQIDDLLSNGVIGLQSLNRFAQRFTHSQILEGRRRSAENFPKQLAIPIDGIGPLPPFVVRVFKDFFGIVPRMMYLFTRYEHLLLRMI